MTASDALPRSGKEHESTRLAAGSGSTFRKAWDKEQHGEQWQRLAELIVQDLATRSDTTRFAMVRFGNVLVILLP